MKKKYQSTKEESKIEKEKLKQENNTTKPSKNKAKSTEKVKDTEDKAKDPLSDKILDLEGKLKDLEDKNLRLFADFENHRKRTAKEKLDLISTANKELILKMLPVLDDFQRASSVFSTTEDQNVKGIELIFQKFHEVLKQVGLSQLEIKQGDEFNSEIQEAITQTPTTKELEGKVVDVLENGYKLNEQIIRFAKVVVGKES